MAGNSLTIEKIRTGEDDPFEVVTVHHDLTQTVINYDDGTIAVTTPDGETTVEELPDASD